MKLTKFSPLLIALLCVASTAHAQKRRSTRPTAPVSAPAPIEPAPVELAPLPVSQTASNLEIRHGLTLDGFVDAALAIPSRNYLYAPGDLKRGFFLNDAALILGKDYARTHAFIELPFEGSGSTTNAFSFATKKAQAFVSMDRGAMVFKFGQYNSFIGIEANDSRDRFFTDSSLVRTFMLPFTHTGVQAAYVMEGSTRFTLRGQVANSNSAGQMGGTQNPELGLQARADATAGYGGLGLLLSEQKGVDSDSMNLLVDLAGGLNFGQLHTGAEVDFKKTGGQKDSGFSILGLLAYQMTPDLALGGRLEYLKNVFVAANEFDNAFSLAVGPSYKIDEGLLLRGDFNVNSVKPTTAALDSRTYFGVNFSAVASL
jgi:hypothetical protein